MLTLCSACGPQSGTKHGGGKIPSGNAYGYSNQQINERNDLLDLCVQQIAEKHTMQEFCTTDVCPSKECKNLCGFIRRTTCKEHVKQ